MNKKPAPQAPEQKAEIAGPKMVGIYSAMEVGYTIAIPVLILAPGGAYLDKYMHTSPLFLIIGLVIAFAASTVGVLQKVQSILARMPKAPPPKDPDADEPSESEVFHEQFQSKP